MAARTGEEFLAGLRDGREIWLGGERVADVTAHPALCGAARSVAELFDLQQREASRCLMPDEETGEPINISHMIPRSREDLERRHICLRLAAEHSVGILGRSPDYMNVTFAGFAGHNGPWAASGNEQGAANLVAYQKELRRRDLVLTHTLIHPTIDRAQGDTPLPGNEVSLRKVGETAGGIVVRGARVLATLAPFADEIAVYPGHSLAPGTEAFALSFSIPVATPGLRFLCRDSYATAPDRFDHPLSSRFDEQDGFAVFEDVEVPGERVFIDGNLDVHNKVMATSWSPNITHQTTIRAHTKLEFAHALASRLAEALNDTRPATTQMLGELWSYAEFARAAILAAEVGARDYGDGAWFPDGRPLTALRATLPQWFPRVNEIIQLIGSHNLLAVASSGMLADAGLRPLIDQYLRGAGEVGAEERSRLFRLAWDFCGSALANRVELYERFYLASGPRNFEIAQKTADWSVGRALVDRFMKDDG
ncbi:MAG: 4-hydroxyphenylacetate 3-hydroxylase family protein [Chloroflexota bacterium]